MKYEETPVKPSKVSAKTLALKELDRVGTASIVWFLIKKHKFGLVLTWAIIITVLYVFPPAPQILLSLIG